MAAAKAGFDSFQTNKQTNRPHSIYFVGMGAMVGLIIITEIKRGVVSNQGSECPIGFSLQKDGPAVC